VWCGIYICLCYKFPTESNSERILTSGHYLVKLWARVRCTVFFDSQCSMLTTVMRFGVVRLVGYLSGTRRRLFAYVLADATAIPKPHCLLPHLNADWFYLYGTGLPGLFWKKGR